MYEMRGRESDGQRSENRSEDVCSVFLFLSLPLLSVCVGCPGERERERDLQAATGDSSLERLSGLFVTVLRFLVVNFEPCCPCVSLVSHVCTALSLRV